MDVIRVVIGEYGFIFEVEKKSLLKENDECMIDDSSYQKSLLWEISRRINVNPSFITLLTSFGEKPTLKNTDQQQTIFLYFKSKNKIEKYYEFSYEWFQNLGIELENDKATRIEKKMKFCMERVTYQKASLRALEKNKNRYKELERTLLDFVRDSENILKEYRNLLSLRLPQQLDEFEREFIDLRSSEESPFLTPEKIEEIRSEIKHFLDEELNKNIEPIRKSFLNGVIRQVKSVSKKYKLKTLLEEPTTTTHPPQNNDLTIYSPMMETNRQALNHNFRLIEIQQKRIYEGYNFQKRLNLLFKNEKFKKLQFLSFLLSSAHPIIEDNRFGRPKGNKSQKKEEEEEEVKESSWDLLSIEDSPKNSPIKEQEGVENNNNERMIDFIQRSIFLSNLFISRLQNYFPSLKLQYSENVIKNHFKFTKKKFFNPLIDKFFQNYNFYSSIKSNEEVEDHQQKNEQQQQNRIKNLENETEKLQMEIEKEKKRNEKMNELYQQLKSDVETMNRLKSERENDIKHLELEVYTLQQQLLKEKDSKTFQERMEKDETFISLKEMSENQIISITHLEQQLKNEKEKVHDIQKNAKLMFHKIKQREEKKEKLLEKGKEKKEKKFEEYRERIEELEEKVENLETSKIEMIESQRNKIMMISEKTKESLGIIRQRLVDSETKKKDLKEYSMKLKKQVRQLQEYIRDGDMNKLSGDETTTTKTTDLKENVDRYSKQVKVLEGTNDIMNRKLKEKETEIIQLKRYIKMLRLKKKKKKKSSEKEEGEEEEEEQDDDDEKWKMIRENKMYLDEIRKLKKTVQYFEKKFNDLTGK